MRSFFGFYAREALNKFGRLRDASGVKGAQFLYDGANYVLGIPGSVNEMFHVNVLLDALSPGIDAAIQERRVIEGRDLIAGGQRSLSGDFRGMAAHLDGVVDECPFGARFMALRNKRFVQGDDGAYFSRDEAGGWFNTVMGILHPERYPQFAGSPVVEGNEPGVS